MHILRIEPEKYGADELFVHCVAVCQKYANIVSFGKVFFVKAFYTIGLLTLSNIFMTLAWYGHLKFREFPWFAKLSLFGIILISWGIAFFEYVVQVPANRMGFSGNGGPFNLWQLKVLQGVITLIVFTAFTLIFFKGESLKWNHIVGFVFLVLAVYFIFKK